MAVKPGERDKKEIPEIKNHDEFIRSTQLYVNRLMEWGFRYGDYDMKMQDVVDELEERIAWVKNMNAEQKKYLNEAITEKRNSKTLN